MVPKSYQNVEKWCPGRSGGVRGAQDAQKLWMLSGFCLDLAPFGEFFGHLFVFVLGLRDAKKGGPGARSKIYLFFLSGFRALPGGPQEGSRLDGSSIFTFTAGAKKGSKMRAKMELLGLPNPNYTHFGPPFGRNGCPKRGVKKVAI